MQAAMQLSRTGWFTLVVMMNFSAASAQSAVNDVPIEPPVPYVWSESFHDLANSRKGLIRESVELVLVPVTVMDGSNRIVTGLQPENFQLYEDKHPQPIKHFWKEDSPVSIGIVLDVSGSMNTKIDRARDAVAAMLKASNLQDEFFLMTFADQPMLVQDFTSNMEDIQGQLLFTRPKGTTCLIDAVVLAVNHLKNARYQRKALVIISDGGDNRSRYTEKDVKSLIKETDIMVYSIGVFDSEFSTQEERLGPELLANISGVTGASSYILGNPKHLPEVAEHIAYELRNQYVIGYRPDGSRRDGKWRKIKIKLALPRGLPSLHAQARTGYYSAAQ
jgi:Ca-activated chloride channel family protein